MTNTKAKEPKIKKYTDEQKKQLIEASNKIGCACYLIMDVIKINVLDDIYEDEPLLHLVMRVYYYTSYGLDVECSLEHEPPCFQPLSCETCSDLLEMTALLKDAFEYLGYGDDDKELLDELIECINNGHDLRASFDVDQAGVIDKAG